MRTPAFGICQIKILKGGKSVEMEGRWLDELGPWTNHSLTIRSGSRKMTGMTSLKSSPQTRNRHAASGEPGPHWGDEDGVEVFM